jgi:tripartite-type tricarboxylate transporter receptor subunit TctC
MKSIGPLLLAALGLLPAALQAQPAEPAFPTRPVTLVVPYTPNSGSDILARILGPKLQARWGQPVVVDNRPGASGNIGAGQVAKSAADGHTLLMMINTFTITPALYKNMPYDPVADFAPVAPLAEAGFAIAVNHAVPAQDVKSLVAWLKQNAGRINYASPGNGTPQHLAMALFMERHGLDVLHVPYKGIGPAITELGGGSVQVMFATVHSVLPMVQAGKVRLLGVSSATRNPLVPQVPTFREQGVEGMDGVDAWYGVLAPARTPPALVQRLNRDFAAVLASDEVKAEAARQGLLLKPGTPAQLGSLIKADLLRWRKVVDDHKITAD